VTDPGELEGEHARAFLEDLAVAGRLAPSSRNQAAAALAFMFREVLGRDEMVEVPRAKGAHRLPLVLTHGEVLRILRELAGKYFLIAVLLYSAGLRLEECLRLRVKDIDFELRQILIRDGKGAKDRYVPLANRAIQLLQAQIRNVARRHRKDRQEGHGWAALPGALHRKDPEAGYEIGWQFVFPAASLSQDPATGRTGRWHLHPTAVQRSVKRAVRRAGLAKRATCHTFRHSFATEALRTGCDIRTLQHVMGHKDIRTTMIYLHVIEQTGHQIRSPLDRPDEPEHGVIGAGDLVDAPWMEPEFHWDLAARQWGRGGKPR
jgi:integron integrase